MIRSRGWLGFTAALLVVVSACAPVPPPGILRDADRARDSARSREAAEYAPQAFAHAEKLRGEAKAALDAHDPAGAQMLSERAIAAYEHADVLARIARAEAITNKSQAEAEQTQAELANLATDQARVAAEVEALERRIKIETEAQAVVPSGPADPAREKERRAAARSFALEARLLCTAAKLLLAGAPEGQSAAKADAPKSDAPKADAPKPDAPKADAPKSDAPAAATAVDTSPAADLKTAEDGVEKLDAALAAAKGATPIDQATRARATCLAVLTKIRRAAAPVSKAPGAGDALYSDLSAMGGLSPSRDDRGVVVTLRGVFNGSALTKAGEDKFAALGRVAAAHPDFPLEIVIHEQRDGAKEIESSRARADVAIKALKAAGARRVDSAIAGAAAPLVEPGSDRAARNARVEIVFVTPESL
jgi:hypothetical protein